jgi:hypothetical protein
MEETYNALFDSDIEKQLNYSNNDYAFIRIRKHDIQLPYIDSLGASLTKENHIAIVKQLDKVFANLNNVFGEEYIRPYFKIETNEYEEDGAEGKAYETNKTTVAMVDYIGSPYINYRNSKMSNDLFKSEEKDKIRRLNNFQGITIQYLFEVKFHGSNIVFETAVLLPSLAHPQQHHKSIQTYSSNSFIKLIESIQQNIDKYFAKLNITSDPEKRSNYTSLYLAKHVFDLKDIRNAPLFKRQMLRNSNLLFAKLAAEGLDIGYLGVFYANKYFPKTISDLKELTVLPYEMLDVILSGQS